MSAPRLRVAVWHNLPSGGGKRALSDQVVGLVRRGHRVESWCPSTADRSFLPLSEVVPEHEVPLPWPVAPRGRGGWATRPYRGAVAEAEAVDRAAAHAAEEIRRGGFDLLFAGPCLLQYAPAIGRFVDLPSVVYLQEPNRDLYEARSPGEDGPRPFWLVDPPRLRPRNRMLAPLTWPKRAIERSLYDDSRIRAARLRGRVERRNVLAFDAVLANSLYSRESIIRAYGLESRVCYLGVDTDRFRPGTAPKEPFVVGLGGLYAAKRPDLAIRSVATIEASRRPPLAWVGNMGDPEYVSGLSALAASLGVDFRPMVRIEHDALVDLLGRAAVMVYPPRLEPFGYAPLEANACGTAVVGVAEGGIRETIRDGVNGTLVDGSDPDRIGRALLAYTDDLDHAARVGNLARREVEDRWGVEASIDRLEAELFRVVEGRRAPTPAFGDGPHPVAARAASP